jgi:hypothetical protein
MYKQIEATPCSKHGLCKWVAEKGKSSLKKFHHLLAHFANQGIRHELLDSLGLWGTARYNLKLDWKWTAISERPEENGPIVSCFRDTPCFYDHSALAEINARARRCGCMHDRHTGLKVLPEDNGEQFLSEYLFAQQERNAVFGKHDINSRYQCNKRASNPVPLPHLQECIQDATPPNDESDESSFGGVAEGFDLDLDLAATPPPRPPAVVLDVTSLERFRRHQELNPIPIILRQIFSPFYSAAAFMPPPPMPTAPMFQPSFQPSFPSFPYTYYAPSFVKKEPKRKWKNNEI